MGAAFVVLLRRDRKPFMTFCHRDRATLPIVPSRSSRSPWSQPCDGGTEVHPREDVALQLDARSELDQLEAATDEAEHRAFGDVNDLAARPPALYRPRR